MDNAPPPSIAEQLTLQFYTWELRGRGWQLWEEPVRLEPPFVPFLFHSVPMLPAVGYDDGRQPGLLDKLKDWFQPAAEPQHGDGYALETDEPLPTPDFIQGPLVGLRLNLPDELQGGKQLAEQFLLALSYCRHAIGYELVGQANEIALQMVCRAQDADHVAAQLSAHYPEIAVSQEDVLRAAWPKIGQTLVVDFGLSREFMLPLRTVREFGVDPLVGFMGALSDLRTGEVAVVQILFAATRCPWSESVLRSVSDGDGGSFFGDYPELLSLAREKISHPLYASVIRVAAKSFSQSRAWAIGRSLGSGLAQFALPNGNELIPLTNDEYPSDWHEQDLLYRQTRRSGMLLSSDELVSLVHLPTDSVCSDKLVWLSRTSKAAPNRTVGGKLILGVNVHRGQRAAVTLSPEQRIRHTHVIGASGTGKSTLLLNMMLQDIEQGHGLALLDPHGDLVDDVIARLPASRVNDVVLFDPADAEWPIGFNILSAHSEVEKTLLSSDLVAVFRRLSTSWGDQMTSVLGNAILAFLESDQGGTLADLRRFLVEPAFRHAFLSTVRDSEVVYYWTKEFPLLAGKPQAPLLTRLDTFLRPKLIRHMVCQKENRLDFASLMNDGKIFLAKLAQGAVGEENAHLLGTLLVAKMHQMALSRQELKQTERRDFFLYLDEFHNFITPSMATILPGVRKYRIGLILAHQELRQLGSQDAEVLSAVLSNPCTRICFRVGDGDAAKLAPGFTSFDAQDLQRLGVGEAIARVERADGDFNLLTPPVAPADEQHAAALHKRICEQSRNRFATPRAEVEERLRQNAPIPNKQAAAATGEPKATPQAARPAAAAPPPTPEVQSQDPNTVVPFPSVRAASPRRPMPTADTPMGKGGRQHKYLQELIKRFAEGLGYRATIELPLSGGGQVDVALEKGELKVACEISITTNADHETGNIQKCLMAGFGHVIAIAPDSKRLEKLRKAILPFLGEGEEKRVRFSTTDDLLALIEELEAQAASTEQTVRGYKVRVNFRPTDEANKQVKKQAISQVIAAGMKRLKGNVK